MVVLIWNFDSVWLRYKPHVEVGWGLPKRLGCESHCQMVGSTFPITDSEELMNREASNRRLLEQYILFGNCTSNNGVNAPMNMNNIEFQARTLFFSWSIFFFSHTQSLKVTFPLGNFYRVWRIFLPVIFPFVRNTDSSFCVESSQSRPVSSLPPLSLFSHLIICQA